MNHNDVIIVLIMLVPLFQSDIIADIEDRIIIINQLNAEYPQYLSLFILHLNENNICVIVIM